MIRGLVSVLRMVVCGESGEQSYKPVDRDPQRFLYFTKIDFNNEFLQLGRRDKIMLN